MPITASTSRFYDHAVGPSDFRSGLAYGGRGFHHLKAVLKNMHSANVGDRRWFLPPNLKSNEEMP
ncbi:MAG: hypothetical protein R2750_00595 [Bacteroidales bacterium]